MKNVAIKGLDESGVELVLDFMKSKLQDPDYISAVEISGNDCDMDWMENGMNISGDDMLHELFELYGKEDQMLSTKGNKPTDDVSYILDIGDNIVITYKTHDDWIDTYHLVKKKK